MVQGIVRAPLFLVAVALLLAALGAGPASGLTWHTETVTAAGEVGGSTSLALNDNGTPTIIYVAKTSRDLKHAWRDTTGWHTERVDTVGSAGIEPSLALDGDGTPRIAYSDDRDGSVNLKYAWIDGTG